MNIKKGDILERKDGGGKCKVLAVIDGDVFILSLVYVYNKAGLNYTISEIEQNYILPKERWVPKVGDFYLSVESYGIVATRKNNDTEIDQTLITIGNCFPETCVGIAEAEAKAVKILAVFKE